MDDERRGASAAERTKALIDASPHEPLTIERLADHAHVSAYHLIREFRCHYHTTPHQYLMRRRIERAKSLLADSEVSVTEICFEVGFESLGSFSDLFHRAVGWPPTVYRARCVARRREPRKFIPTCFWIMHHLDAVEATPALE